MDETYSMRPVTGRAVCVVLLAAGIFFSFAIALCPIEATAKAKKSAAKKSQRVEQTDDREEEAERRDVSSVTGSPVMAAEKSDDPTKKKEDPPKDAKEKAAADKGTIYDYEKPTAEEESYAWLIFKTLFILGLLVGGFYYFFRFVTKKAGVHVLGRDVVHVLSVVPLAQNKFLQVVDLAGRIIVLGVSDNNINIITEITDRDEIDRIRLLSSKSSPVSENNFQDFLVKQLGSIGQLGRFFRRSAGGGRDGDTGYGGHDHDVDRLDYLRRQRERLKNLNGKDHE